jgi:galactose mutarotase-like enzyme
MILENDIFGIRIDNLGAELKSVYHKLLQKEILYQGNTKYWNRSSPVLFPIVGRLKENSYFIKERKFHLNQHGFARDSIFEISYLDATSCTFSLKSNQDSLEIFPFEFELQISYILEKNRLRINYKLINCGAEELPFSIGAHPGFVCPFFENENFEDYYLEFETDEVFKRYLLNCDTGLFNGREELIESKDREINLKYEFFLKDAIVFKDLKSTWVKLKSRKSSYCLTFSFKDFPYFGIWTKENAPFICLEPWCGLADSENSRGGFLEKEGINILKNNEVFEKEFGFELIL